MPARARRLSLVALDGGAVVGYGSAYFKWEGGSTDEARAWVAVRPGHRGRGLGTELAERVERHSIEAGREAARDGRGERLGRRSVLRSLAATKRPRPTSSAASPPTVSSSRSGTASKSRAWTDSPVASATSTVSGPRQAPSCRRGRRGRRGMAPGDVREPAPR